MATLKYKDPNTGEIKSVITTIVNEQNSASQVIIAMPVINEETGEVERVEVTNKTSEELVALWNNLMDCNENINPPILLYKSPTSETIIMNLYAVDDGDMMNIRFNSTMPGYGLAQEIRIDAENPNSCSVNVYDIMPDYDAESEEGNILRIVNGYAQWTPLPNAEEASF